MLEARDVTVMLASARRAVESGVAMPSLPRPLAEELCAQLRYFGREATLRWLDALEPMMLAACPVSDGELSSLCGYAISSILEWSR